MTVAVRAEAFDPWRELQAHQDAGVAPGSYGATAVFVGTMRDFNAGDGVNRLHLEHYPGMTEQYLENISQEARRRWDLLDTLILHRVGDLEPNEPIVLVAVWSSHRAAAFEASRWLMEELKSRAPFWKKEVLAEGGERWVEHNTPGK
jgi:molybdopterin synthase catalytic subunit